MFRFSGTVSKNIFESLSVPYFCMNSQSIYLHSVIISIYSSFHCNGQYSFTPVQDSICVSRHKVFQNITHGYTGHSAQYPYELCPYWIFIHFTETVCSGMRKKKRLEREMNVDGLVAHLSFTQEIRAYHIIRLQLP